MALLNRNREHGGAVFRAADDLGLPVSAILDFSASINPLGMPQEVRDAACAAVAAAVHYPEIDGASLAAALAQFHGLAMEQLLPAAGSTELIYLLPRVLRPRRALVVAPAFSEYQRSLHQAGAAVDHFPLSPDAGFELEPYRMLGAVTPETDLVLLANPGNPTGAALDPAAIETIARALREQALVVVDEAFVDFCPERSLAKRVAAHDNLYLLRSLTKFYALPGLRAGYLIGPPRGVARLAACRDPWTLSTPALAAACACLGLADYRRRSLELIPLWRAELAAGLTALGLTVFPGAANFMLAQLAGTDPGASELAGTLYRQGILIRACSNFPPLDDRFLRVAVRGPEDNARLLTALAAALPSRPAPRR